MRRGGRTEAGTRSSAPSRAASAAAALAAAAASAPNGTPGGGSGGGGGGGGGGALSSSRTALGASSTERSGRWSTRGIGAAGGAGGGIGAAAAAGIAGSACLGVGAAASGEAASRAATGSVGDGVVLSARGETRGRGLRSKARCSAGGCGLCGTRSAAGVSGTAARRCRRCSERLQTVCSRHVAYPRISARLRSTRRKPTTAITRRVFRWESMAWARHARRLASSFAHTARARACSSSRRPCLPFSESSAHSRNV